MASFKEKLIPEVIIKKKSINSELWHACAGPLVTLPQVGSLVYYFPQGHSEQLAVSTNRTATSHVLPNYRNLPSQLLCQVHEVTLHASEDTDEVYAQMRLQPVNSERDVLPIPDIGVKSSKHPSVFFSKTLTASDTSCHGGFSVPRRAAEKLLPELVSYDLSSQPPTQELVVRDVHHNTWTFQHVYRGQPKRHLLTTGWAMFVAAKRLRAGDVVVFIRDENSRLLLGVRRAICGQTALRSSLLSVESMHIGLLATAAHAAANQTQFTIFYNPRTCPREFVIPLVKYRRAVYTYQLSVGMRFKKLFETESGTRRYMGTIVGISELDPLRWPCSMWRNLQVEWDEPLPGGKQNRVSPWEIESADSLFIFPSRASTLKRPLQSAFSDTKNEWDVMKTQPCNRAPAHTNGTFPYLPMPNLWSYQLIQMLIKPQHTQDSTANAAALQEPKTSRQTMVDDKIPVPSEHTMTQTKYVSKFQCIQSDTTAPNLSNLPQNLEAGNVRGNQAQIEPHQSSQFTSSVGNCNEEKLASNAHNVIDEMMPVNLKKYSPKLESSPNLAQCSQLEVATLNGPLLSPDANEWHPNSITSQSLSGYISPPNSSALFLETVDPNLPSTGHEIWDMDNFETSIQTNSNILKDISDNTSDHNNNLSDFHTCLNFETCNVASLFQNNSCDPFLLSAVDEFCPLKDCDFHNPCDCLVSNFSSSQDITIQSQITSTSLPDLSRAIPLQRLPDTSGGGPSSSNAELVESSRLQNGLQQQEPPRIRTYTKIQKAGSVMRSVDVSRFKNYEEIRCEIEHMFGLEGLLNDSKDCGWKLVYIDFENDILLLGDDPWEEFVGCVRCIRILSPEEVKHMDEEGMQLLNRMAVPSVNVSVSDN